MELEKRGRKRLIVPIHKERTSAIRAPSVKKGKNRELAPPMGMRTIHDREMAPPLERRKTPELPAPLHPRR